MRNIIIRLENDNSIFMMDKEKGEFWGEIRTKLQNCSTQSEYNRELEFENRDLQLRERKHECYSLFQQILNNNPDLAENATYTYAHNELFSDFLNEKRTQLDEEGGDVLLKDKRELSFLDRLKKDLERKIHLKILTPFREYIHLTLMVTKDFALTLFPPAESS